MQALQALCLTSPTMSTRRRWTQVSRVDIVGEVKHNACSACIIDGYYGTLIGSRGCLTSDELPVIALCNGFQYFKLFTSCW